MTSPTAEQRTLAVVVLNWRQAAASRRCIDSLRASRLPDAWALRLVLVDNASGDGSYEQLAELADVAVQTGANGGFAFGNNAGVRAALDLGADAVMLLNNDATVAQDTIARLIAALPIERAALLAPKIVNPDGLTWFDAAALDRRTARSGPPGSGSPFLPGCCLLAWAETWDALHPLDERLFMYWEDNVLCTKAAQAGVELRSVPDAVVCHATSTSSGGGANPLKWYYVTRNRLWVVRMPLVDVDRRAALLATPRLVIGDCVGILKSSSTAPLREIRAVLLGVLDGLGRLPRGTKPHLTRWRL